MNNSRVYIECAVARIEGVGDDRVVIIEVPDPVEGFAQGGDDPHYIALSLVDCARIGRATPEGFVRDFENGRRMLRVGFEPVSSCLIS